MAAQTIGQRSRAYPGVSLESSISHAVLVRKNLGKGFNDRESIAKAIGHETFNGTVGRKVAAMAYFGLLKRDGDKYALSELSDSISIARNDQERSDAIAAAFGTPTLYKELLTKYKPEGQVPKQLTNLLVRDHGISEVAAPDAARIFLESGKLAGVLNSDGEFVARGKVESESPNNYGQEVDGEIGDEESDEPRPSADKNQQFIFSLTEGKFAKLVVPSSLNARDVKIIGKQLELLALQAGDEQ